MITKNNKRGHTLIIDESKGYFSYLWSAAKRNGIYKLIKRLADYFSRFRIISITARILGFIFTAIETSAVVFIIAITGLILLPPVILGFLTVIGSSSLYFRRDSQRLLRLLGDKKIIVFFTERKQKFNSDSFFLRNASELSKRGYSIIIVTPFVISRFLGDQKFFLNLTEHNGVIMIRQQFFFWVKKHLFKDYNKKLIYVY